MGISANERCIGRYLWANEFLKLSSVWNRVVIKSWNYRLSELMVWLEVDDHVDHKLGIGTLAQLKSKVLLARVLSKRFSLSDFHHLKEYCVCWSIHEWVVFLHDVSGYGSYGSVSNLLEIVSIAAQIAFK